MTEPTNDDQIMLAWLANEDVPAWSAHLEQGTEPSDLIKRWLACGWIERFEDEGYVITDAGRAVAGRPDKGAPHHGP